MFRKCVRTVIVVGLAANIAGCVLINPHIEFEGPSADDVNKAQAYSLPWAKAYANNAKKAYIGALGEYATFSSLLGIGLIPIAASGAGLGAVGGNPNAVIALALAGASGYGIGTWLESKPRQKAYILGYEATVCAIEAILPLEFTATKKSALETNRKNLNSAIGEVETQIGKTSGAADKVAGESELKTRAISDSSAAQQVVAAAKITHKNGVELERNIDLAGGMLKEAVDKIKGQVSSAVIELSPTAESLRNIIDGLAKSYKKFAPVSEGQKTSKDVKGGGEATDKGIGVKMAVGRPVPPEEQLRRELNNLRDKVSDLANKNREIADLVAIISSAEPTETLKKCGVKESDIALGISVAVHGSLEFEQGTPGTGGFTVSGGSEKFRFTIHGSSDKLPTVEQDSPFGGGFIVKTKAETKAGLSKILIQDTAGHRQFVDVTVKPKKKKDKGTGGSETTKPTATLNKTEAEAILKVFRATFPKIAPVDKDLKIGEGNIADWTKSMEKYVEEIQIALGIFGSAVDGVMGLVTRDKIRKFIPALGDVYKGAKDGSINEKLLTSLLANPVRLDEAIAKKNGPTKFESTFSKDAEKEALASELKVGSGAFDGEITDETRGKIADARKRIGLLPSRYMTALMREFFLMGK